MAAACSLGATGMTCEIQNCAPSRENVDDAVPLMLPQTVMNSAAPSTTRSGSFSISSLSMAMASPSPPAASPLPGPTVAMSTNRAGSSTLTSTPLSKKMGVRFMIFHSRPNTAAKARRPPATRRDISSPVSRRLFPVVSPRPMTPR